MRARLHGLVTGIIITIGLLKSFVYLRVDPDAQHSGFVYAQAIAVSNGLLPNKNFLSPYGVIGPMLNGLWLKLTVDSLFNLLFLYGILTVLTGYLIQRNASRYVDRKVGILLNLTWVLMMATTIPWPSILSTFLCIASFTILIENISKFRASTKVSAMFLFPVVICLQLSVLTRIQLLVVPLAFSIYLLCNLRKLNKPIVKFWFVTNLVIGLSLLAILIWAGIFSAYIEQAILWPMTEFSHPSFNLSWWFSFVWFPLSGLLLLASISIGIKVFNEVKISVAFAYMAVLVLIFFGFYLLAGVEFSGQNTNTLRTLPGLIKNASINFQFIVFYSSASLFLAGIVFYFLGLRKVMAFGTSKFFDLEHFIILLMGVTGLSQLYPLRDNVHLWFVAPLLLVSSSYYFGLVQRNRALWRMSLAVTLGCLVFVQSITLLKFAITDRDALTSYALRGLVSNSNQNLGADSAMRFFDENLTGRALRNNCIDSLFSVAKGRYISIDGNFSANSFKNFTDVLPIVDPSSNQPLYTFECRISISQIQKFVRQGAVIVFQSPNISSTAGNDQYFNVLFQNQK